MSTTRSVFKSKLKKIERIWAENGLVMVQSKSGDSRAYRVSEAAKLAKAINQMPVERWNRSRKNEVVNMAVKACREAKAQRESPDNKTKIVTQGVTNTNEDGSPHEQTMDQKVSMNIFMYPTLSEREIITVLEDKHLTEEQKKTLLNDIHMQNVKEQFKD